MAIHASFLLTAVILLLLGPSRNVSWQIRLDCVGALFLAVVTHELGQLLGRRLAHESHDGRMVLSSLGGQDFLQPRRGPRTIAAILCGPGANFLLCGLCGMLLLTAGVHTLNPIRLFPRGFSSWTDPIFHLRVLYAISAAFLLLNLLPLFPLDGGKILHLWLTAGEGAGAALNMTTLIGLFGSGMLAIISLVIQSWLLLFIASYIFVACMATRWLHKPHALVEPPDAPDYPPLPELGSPARRKRRLRGWTARRLRRLAHQEEQDQLALDAILAKVSAFGLSSLTWREKRILRDATLRQWAGEDDEPEVQPH